MSEGFASAEGVAHPHMWISGFFGEYQASFTLPLDSDELMEAALERIRRSVERLKAMGFTAGKPTKQELSETEDKAMVTALMRRHKEDGTPLIDFYPDFKPGRNPAEPFGCWRWMSVYLNNQEDINNFLSITGFKSLDDIPLYDDDGKPRKAGYKRENSQRHPKERVIPTPFFVVRKPNPQWLSDEQIAAAQAEGKAVDVEKNKFRQKHILARYETADGRTIEPSRSSFAQPDAPEADPSEPEPEIREQNFHAVKVDVIKGQSGKPAYRIATTNDQLVWTNTNEQFVKAGYEVLDQIGSKFDFIPQPYIEAVEMVKNGKPVWMLKTDAMSVVRPDPDPLPEHEIPV